MPLDWSVLPFETTKGEASSIGVQLSNVPLPPPRIEPGFPIQADLRPSPRGVSVLIATDDDPALVGEQTPLASLPLSLTDSGFAEGSCIAEESACLSTLWFTAGGKTLLISIKTGPFASKGDLATLGPLLASIRADT